MRNVRTILAALATLALSAGTAAAGDPKAAPAPAKAAEAKTPVAQATPAPGAKPAPAPAAKAAATPAPAAKPAATPAAKPAPAAGAKPAAGAAVKADAKIAPGEPNPAEPPKPAPAPELVAAAKAQVGTWRCAGNVFGPDGAPRATKAVLKTKVDLDKFWLQSSFAETAGKNKFKFTSYRTFDAASKKWSSVMLDNWGGYAVSTSSDGVAWEGTSHSPMGTMKAKDTETVVSPREVKMAGQYSSDNGKTWVPGYDLTCKK
jgi:hypothetical protein